MDDQHDHNWDLHLRRLLGNGDGLPRVARLVFDIFDDLYLDPPASLLSGNLHTIKYLLRSLEVEQDHSNKEDLILFEGRYVVVQYRELHRSIKEKRMRNASAFSGERRTYLCGTRKNLCIFKYWEELPDDKGRAYNCGVCEKRVISGHPVYSCIDCFLLLHKSCASTGVDTFEGFEDIEFLRDYPNRGGVHVLACDSCIKEGKSSSPKCTACRFQTHLKCRVLPTILNHDCHDHFLSLSINAPHKCAACGIEREFGGSYECYICSMDYDIDCMSQLREVEHEHGGHKHVLKLKYSHDGMEEEAYWCDFCYEDMDPQNWFYYCQDCPYYSAHPRCVRLSGGTRITASSL